MKTIPVSANTEPDQASSSDGPPDCECGHPPSNHGDRVFSGKQCFTEVEPLRVFGTLAANFEWYADRDMSCECPGYTPGKILESV